MAEQAHPQAALHSGTRHSGTLQHGKLSNGAVLFQSVSQIAPAGGIATVAIIGADFAGGALTLATIISVVACLLAALSVSQLARYLPSAGSLGTYVSRSLGGGTGFVTGWMYAISEMLIVSFVALLVGGLVAGVGSSEFGWPVTTTWVVTVIAMYLLVAAVHELGVNVSTRVQQVISSVEVLLFVVLSIVLIAKAGGRNSVSVFGTAHGNVPGYLGAAGLFPAAVFIITAFGGFETAASLAEEAREPRRAVRTAVVGAVLGVGVLYVLTSYAATVYFGPDRMGGFAAFNGGDPWTGMTREVWGVGWVALFLVVVNSLYGAGNAATNVSTRMLMSLGRAGLGPAPLGRVSRRHSPSLALACVAATGLGLALWLGVQYGPLTGLSIMVVTSTALYITIYILVNLACPAYFLRHQRQEFGWLRHLVLPLAGAAVFVPVLLSELGIPAFSFISRLHAPLTYGAYAAVAIAVAAVAAAAWIAIARPGALARLGAAFDETAGDTALAGSAPPPQPGPRGGAAQPFSSN
jgi:amino acid transporter